MPRTSKGAKTRDKRARVDIRKDAKGQMHVYLPGVQFGKLLGGTGLNSGMLRTVARGDRTISVTGGAKPKDMRKGDFEELKGLLEEFFSEEEREAEHAGDGKHCDCGNH